MSAFSGRSSRFHPAGAMRTESAGTVFEGAGSETSFGGSSVGSSSVGRLSVGKSSDLTSGGFSPQPANVRMASRVKADLNMEGCGESLIMRLDLS